MAILSYREFAAPERLRRYVRCAWHLELDADPDHVETIYPDGCCELIAHRKHPMHALDAARGWRQQERCLFAAQQRSAIRLSARSDVDCIGVRLQPAASALLFEVSLADLRDRIVDLASMDPELSRGYAAAALQPDLDTSVADVWKLLEHRFAPLQIDQRIETAVGCLEISDGCRQVAHIISESGMSPRSFQIAFQEQVGLSPKEFARILRLQATIRMLDEGERPVSQVAADSGFSDQAHATREVRRVTGTTPARLRNALRENRSDDTSIRLPAAFVRGRLGGPD
jgi:AraC-like DNA-binding protein